MTEKNIIITIDESQKSDEYDFMGIIDSENEPIKWTPHFHRYNLVSDTDLWIINCRYLADLFIFIIC